MAATAPIISRQFLINLTAAAALFCVQTVLFADFPCALGIELCKHENRD